MTLSEELVIQRNPSGRRKRRFDLFEDGFVSSASIGETPAFVTVYNPDSVDGRILISAFGAHNDGAFKGTWGKNKYILRRKGKTLELWPDSDMPKATMQEGSERLQDLIALYEGLEATAEEELRAIAAQGADRGRSTAPRIKEFLESIHGALSQMRDMLEAAHAIPFMEAQYLEFVGRLADLDRTLEGLLTR